MKLLDIGALHFIPAAAGNGEICWGISNSPFGNMFLAASRQGITHLSFFDRDETEALAVLKRDWPAAVLHRDDSLAQQRHSGALLVKGTAFQKLIWQALLKIPCGETISYGKLAEKLGMKGAAQALGQAVGANRIAYLIPCHRIVRSDGALGGYRWGMDRKMQILGREKRVDLTLP
jgi:AraC family transcriptional regulator of adaptative response/methylated-DNA-[protein]-cysteine methyltransferase